MLKFLIPTKVIKPTGKIATTLRMQKPTTRKCGRKLKSCKGQGQSPESC
jgi:hypothetical protein